MAEIKVNVEKIDPTLIETIYFSGNIPVLDIMKHKYWNGTEEEYSDFLSKNGIETTYSFKTITDLHNKTNEIIKKLLATFPKDIGKFDVKIIPAIKQRNLREVTDDDYDLLTFDLNGFNEEEKEICIDSFFDAFSLSIYDFKKLEEDKLLLFYNRRGFAEEDDRVSLVQARSRATLLQNFKTAKDNNYICADLILQMSKTMASKGFSLEDTCFSYSQKTPNGEIREWKKTLSEVLDAPKMTTEERELEKEKERIKQEAQEEIKKELAETRQSLPPESTKIELTRPGNSQVKNEEFLTSDMNLEETLKKLSQEYDAKEIEKTRIRLAEADKEVKNIYEMMKELLNKGTTVLEALNIAKQKARYAETVQKASFALTTDLLRVQQKDLIIKEQAEIISLKDIENNKLSESLIKREETISELRGTVNRKNIEITNIVEKHEKDIEEMTKETQKTINTLKKQILEYEEKIGGIMDKHEKDIEGMIAAQKEIDIKREEEFKSILTEQLSLIDKLELEKNHLESSTKENKEIQSKQEEKIEKLTRENAVLLDKNNKIKELEEKIEKLEKENKIIQHENENLKQKSKIENSYRYPKEMPIDMAKDSDNYERVENIISKKE